MTDIDIELDENYLNDGPVACDDCGEIFPASALYGDGLCGLCGALADMAFARKLTGETEDDQC